MKKVSRIQMTKALPSALQSPVRERYAGRIAEGLSDGHIRYEAAPISGLSNKESGRSNALEVVRQRFPGVAAELDEMYGSRLPNERNQLIQAWRDAQDGIERRNAPIRVSNRAIARIAQKTEEQSLTDLGRIAEEIVASDKDLTKFQLDAATKVANSGAIHNANRLDPATVLRSSRRPLARCIAEIGRPTIGGLDAVILPSWAMWAAAAVIGAVQGLCVALAGRIAEPDALDRYVPQVVFFTSTGAVVGLISKSAVGGAWFLVGGSAHRKTPTGQWWAYLGFALGLSAIVIVIDAAIVSSGLLAQLGIEAAVASLSGGATAVTTVSAAMWLPAFFYGFTIVAASSYHAYFHGMRAEILGQASGYQEIRAYQDDREERASPVNREAMRSIAVVEMLRQRIATLRGAAGENANGIEKLLARTRPEETSPNADEQAAINRQRDVLVGNTLDADRRLSAALEACGEEPAFGGDAS